MNRRSFFSKLGAAVASAAVAPAMACSTVSGVQWPYLINRRYTQGYFICQFEKAPLVFVDWEKYYIPILHERTH